jgi:hypothetical protein
LETYHSKPESLHASLAQAFQSPGAPPLGSLAVWPPGTQRARPLGWSGAARPALWAAAGGLPWHLASTRGQVAEHYPGRGLQAAVWGLGQGCARAPWQGWLMLGALVALTQGAPPQPLPLPPQGAPLEGARGHAWCPPAVPQALRGWGAAGQVAGSAPVPLAAWPAARAAPAPHSGDRASSQWPALAQAGSPACCACCNT